MKILATEILVSAFSYSLKGVPLEYLASSLSFFLFGWNFTIFSCFDIWKVVHCICSIVGDNEEGQKKAGAYLQCDWPG